MTDNTLSVPMVINAPAERVWSLFIEEQQSNKQETQIQKYIHIDSKEPLAAGQVIHMKIFFLHMNIFIDQVVQAEPPFEGQTTSARMKFFGKEGKGVFSWFRDVEHHHMQTETKINHPWWTSTEKTNIRCIAIDTTSCVAIHDWKSETTFRLLPRWLKRQSNNNKTEKEMMTKFIEKSLQAIKAKAEKNSIVRE